MPDNRDDKESDSKDEDEDEDDDGDGIYDDYGIDTMEYGEEGEQEGPAAPAEARPVAPGTQPEAEPEEEPPPPPRGARRAVRSGGGIRDGDAPAR